MKTFKKFAGILLAVILLLLIVHVGINLFDESLNPKAYTLKDLPEASFEPTNGFFHLWGLAEPVHVDVLSENYIQPLRKINHPRERSPEAAGSFDSDTYKRKSGGLYDDVRKIKFPRYFKNDLITELGGRIKEIEAAQASNQTILKRYNDLLSSAVIRDITYPSFVSPIPNLMTLLMTSKLHTAVAVTKAIKGDWQQAAADLIKQVDMARRLITGSRVLILNLIGKAVINISLQGLVSMINHRDCPDEVLHRILDRCKPLTYEEYGSAGGFIFECLSCFNAVDGNLESLGKYDPHTSLPTFITWMFLQKNRTKNYFYNHYAELIHYEQTDPYKWQKNPFKQLPNAPERIRRGLWFIQNPVGKFFFSVAVPKIASIIFKSNQLRCRFQMMRILAEFQLKYTPGRTVSEVLNELNAYKAMDPGSGKPYKWNGDKKLLYGIGTDGTDNNGTEDGYNLDRSDFVIPLKIRK